MRTALPLLCLLATGCATLPATASGAILAEEDDKARADRAKRSR
ncbi:hypothetical protein [Stigmatella hybrida]|nr:hypothetical protein [Stigmatella hybrida]